MKYLFQPDCCNIFMQGLTDIIQRDFFPDVKKLEAQIESSDSNVGTSARLDPTEEKSAVPKNATTLGLDQFLNKYESEDDASFKEMLIKSNEIHLLKHAWLHEKEQEYAKLVSEEKLAVTGNTEPNRRAGLDSWTYTSKNSLMYIPDGVENSAMETVQGATSTREIVHCNTRMPHQFVQKFHHSTTSDCIRRHTQDKVGVDGKILPVDESPSVNGYGFLATPSINPGNIFACADKSGQGLIDPPSAGRGHATANAHITAGEV